MADFTGNIKKWAIDDGVFQRGVKAAKDAKAPLVVAKINEPSELPNGQKSFDGEGTKTFFKLTNASIDAIYCAVAIIQHDQHDVGNATLLFHDYQCKCPSNNIGAQAAARARLSGRNTS